MRTSSLLITGHQGKFSARTQANQSLSETVSEGHRTEAFTQAEWHRLKRQFSGSERHWPTAAVIGLDLIAVGSSCYFQSLGGLCYLAGLALLIPALLHAYLLLHEATHSAVSANKRINETVGHICGWLILMPFLARQRSHLLHHIWTAHPTGDPANERAIRRFAVMNDQQASRLEELWRSWIPVLTLNDRIGLWLDPFQQRRQGASSSRIPKEIAAIYAYLAAYGILAITLLSTRTLGGFLVWFGPSWIALLFLEELANLPYHAETPLQHETEKALPYWQQHEVTHSCRSSGIWSGFILMNFNLHTAHHLFPWIPWSALPQAHRELLKHLPQLDQDQQTRNELAWSLVNRRRPLLEIMGHYFDRIPRSIRPALPPCEVPLLPPDTQESGRI